jgi:hypothetical protein
MRKPKAMWTNKLKRRRFCSLLLSPDTCVERSTAVGWEGIQVYQHCQQSSPTVPTQIVLILPKSQRRITTIWQGTMVNITEKSIPPQSDGTSAPGGGGKAKAFQLAFSVSMAHCGVAVGASVACCMLPGAPYLAETAQHKQPLLSTAKQHPWIGEDLEGSGRGLEVSGPRFEHKSRGLPLSQPTRW